MDLRVSVKETPELAQIELSKAEQIAQTFEPMVKMLRGFEESYECLVKSSEEDGISLETTAKAKRLRLDIAKVRIATDKARKEQKKEYLLAGRAIDGVANILKWATSEKEEKLSEIENHYELMEQRRLEELQQEREFQISEYLPDGTDGRDFSTMEDDVWEAFLATKKKEHLDRIEAEKQAELDRIEREKEEKAERARIEAENAKLRKEAEAREQLQKKRAELMRPYIQFIRDYSKMLNLSESAFSKELEDVKKGAQDHWEFEALRKEKEEEEKQKAERAERAERAKQEAILKSEREARDKAERELKAKREQELKEQAEREAKIQAELVKGDSAKLEDLIQDLENIKEKYSFKSVKNKAKMDDVRLLLTKVINHIRK